MSVKLLTEHYLEFLRSKGGCTGSFEPNLSKYHIVGNHMSRLIFLTDILLNLSEKEIVQTGKACANKRVSEQTVYIGVV